MSDRADNALVRWYASHVADPRSSVEAYGYWALIVGGSLAVLGTGCLSVGTIVGRSSTVVAVAGGFLGIGAALFLVGAVLHPVRIAGEAPHATATSDDVDDEAEPDDDAANSPPPDHDGRFAVEIFEENGWYWRVLDADGSAVAAATTPAGSAAAARDRLADLEGAFAGAPVEVVDGPRDSRGDDAGDSGTAEVTEDAQRPARPEGGSFALSESDGTWRWELRDAGDAAVATARVRHESVGATRETIGRIQDEARDVGTLQYDPAGFEVYRPPADADPVAASSQPLESDGETDEVTDGETGTQWCWRLVDRDGTVLAQGPLRDSRDGAMAAVERLKSVVDGDHDPELVESADGWRWELVDEETTLAVAPSAIEAKERTLEAFDTAVDRIPEAGVLVVDPFGFQVAATEDDGWVFRLRDRDGTVVAAAREFGSSDAAVERLRRFVRIAPNADVRVHRRETTRIIEDALADAEAARALVEEVSTDADDALESIETAIRRATEQADRDAPEDTVEDPTESEAMAGETADASTSSDSGPDHDEGTPVFEVVDDDGSGWTARFRLGEQVLAEDGGGHPDRSAAIDAVERLADLAGRVETTTVDPADFQVRPDGEGWTWRLVASDGAVLARAGEPHGSEATARETVSATRSAIQGGSEFYEEDGWRWRIRHDDRILARAPEGYDSTDDARAALDRARELADAADLTTLSDAVAEIHPTEGGWGWRLRSAEDRVVLTATGYESAHDAGAAFSLVRATAPTAPIRITRDRGTGERTGATE